MANHFIAINRGKEGLASGDFTTGTSSSAASDFELRIADVDANGGTPLEKDVILALKAFIRFLENPTQSNFPPL